MGIGHLLQKLTLVFWRIAICRKRRWCITFLELFVPQILFILLMALWTDMSLFAKRNHTHVERSKAEIISRLINLKYVAYSPSNNYTDNLMKVLVSKLQLGNEVLLPCRNEDEIENQYNRHVLNSAFYSRFAGVAFETADLLQKFTYKIRMPLPLKYCCSENRLQYSNTELGIHEGYETYYDSGFLAFQWLLDETYIESKFGWSSLPVIIQFQSLSYSSRKNAEALECMLKIIVPLLLMLSFLTLLPVIVKRMIEDKEGGFHAYMKIAGSKAWLLILEQLFDAALINMVPVTVIVLLFCFDWAGFKIIEHYHPVMIWFFLFSYLISGTALVFFVCSIFIQTYTATVCIIILWLVTYYTPMIDCFSSTCPKVLFSLFPNAALRWGMYIIAVKELNTGLEENDLMPVFTMFYVSALLYIFMAWYVEYRCPGKFQISEECHFLCVSLRRRPKYREPASEPEKFANNTEIDSSIAICFQNVSKMYGSWFINNRRAALRDVTLDIYENKTTVLLGHKGAGKTVILSLLTRLCKRSKGSIFVNIDGKPRRRLGTLRNKIGYCPQVNTFLSFLTVEEHFMLFAQLRKSSFFEARSISNYWVTKLGLLSWKHTFPSTLSVGYQRLCCIGFAFVGGPRFVFLDSPAEKVQDPRDRKKIWDIIIEMRGKCTMVIGTNMVEEAFVLADHITVITKGQVEIFGNISSLMTYYADCLEVKIIKGRQCDVAALTRYMHAIIPEAIRKTEDIYEVTFYVPLCCKDKLVELQSHLKKRAACMGLVEVIVSQKVEEAPQDNVLTDGSVDNTSMVQKMSTYVTRKLLTAKEDSTSSEEESTENTTSSTSSDIEVVPGTKPYSVMPVAAIFEPMNVSFGPSQSATGSEVKELYRELLQVDVKPNYADVPLPGCDVGSEQSRYQKILEAGMGLSDIDYDDPFSASCIRKFIYIRRKYGVFLSLAVIQVLLVFLVRWQAREMNYQYPKIVPRNLSILSYRDIHVYSIVEQKGLSNMSEYYKNLVRSTGKVHNVVSSTFQDISMYMNQSNLTVPYKKLLVAAKFGNAQLEAIDSDLSQSALITAIYSDLAEHSAPISLNLITNTLLQYFSRTNEVAITAFDHPLREPSHLKYFALNNACNCSGVLLWSLLMPVGLLLLVSTSVMYPTLHRTSQIRAHKLARVGFSNSCFWSACYIVDYFSFSLVMVLLITVLFIFDIDDLLYGFAEYYTLFLILYLYGMCGMVFTYGFSCLFSKSSNHQESFAYILVLNIFSGTALKLLMSILEQNKVRERDWIKNSLELIPYYTLTHSLEHFIVISMQNKIHRLNLSSGDGLCYRNFAGNHCHHIGCGEPCDPVCNSIKPYIAWPNEDNPYALLNELLNTCLNMALYAILLFVVPLVFKRRYTKRVAELYAS